MLKGIKRFFVYMLMLFVVTATLQCAVYASERPNSKIDNDWVYYNVQDVFPWAGFEYELCDKAGKDYTQNQTTITSSIAFPDFFVAAAKRNGTQGLQLSADTTMDTASIFNHAVSSKKNVYGPAVGGTLYDSGAKYDNLSQAAEAKKRFLLSGWVKPLENVSAVKVVLNIKKTGENTVSETVVKSVNMTGATDWTYVGGVVDFDKMFNGNTAGYVLPTGFPSAVESFNDAEWEISLGIVLEKADKNKALNAYVDDYEIIEQTKTAWAKGTNLWEDPDCEGIFDNFSIKGGVADTSGKATDVKYSGNSSFKFVVANSSAWIPQMLGRYMQLNPLKPYYYSFYVKTSEPLKHVNKDTGKTEKIKIALIYRQYGLTNSNAALNYIGKSQLTLANVEVENSTEWQHFSGVALLRQYRDVTYTNKITKDDKYVSSANLLRPEDQFVNSDVYFTVSKAPTNKTYGYSLYFDNIELRELPLNDDEPSSPVLYNPNDRSYNTLYKEDTIYGLTEHFQDGVQIYDGQATAGKPMTIKTVLINGTPNQNATIITALYDKDTDNLVDVVFSQPQSIPEKNVLTYEHNVNIPQGFDGYIKTFVFDSFDNIKPLDEVATFNMTAPTDDVVVLTVKQDGTGDFESPYLANQSITDSSKKKNI